MSRTVKIAIAAPEADRLVELLGQTEGVIGMSLQPGASLKPRGDVLTVDVTNEGFERLLDEIHAGGFGETSIVTSEPRSVVSSSYQQAIDGETNESSWHEMSALLHRESNVTTNYLIAMFSAGLIAGAGLWTETVHIVVGAMVIALVLGSLLFLQLWTERLIGRILHGEAQNQPAQSCEAPGTD